MQMMTTAEFKEMNDISTVHGAGGEGHCLAFISYIPHCLRIVQQLRQQFLFPNKAAVMMSKSFNKK